MVTPLKLPPRKSPDDIAVFLEQLKGKVTECSNEYIKRIELSIQNANKINNVSLAEDTGEQGRLNKIIAALNFDNIEELRKESEIV